MRVLLARDERIEEVLESAVVLLDDLLHSGKLVWIFAEVWDFPVREVRLCAFSQLCTVCVNLHRLRQRFVGITH